MAVAYRRLGGRRDLAEDAAQEAFLRLLRAQPFARLADGHALRGFVWRIADNVARTCRRAIEASGHHESLDAVLEDAPGTDAAQDRILEAREKLGSTLAGLQPVDRQILVMTAVGNTIKEIAEATGLSYSNAAVRLHRLRNHLQHKGLSP